VKSRSKIVAGAEGETVAAVVACASDDAGGGEIEEETVAAVVPCGSDEAGGVEIAETTVVVDDDGGSEGVVVVIIEETTLVASDECGRGEENEGETTVVAGDDCGRGEEDGGAEDEGGVEDEGGWGAGEDESMAEYFERRRSGLGVSDNSEEEDSHLYSHPEAVTSMVMLTPNEVR
jgi:hypothetical protein